MLNSNSNQDLRTAGGEVLLPQGLSLDPNGGLRKRGAPSKILQPFQRLQDFFASTIKTANNTGTNVSATADTEIEDNRSALVLIHLSH